MSVSTSLGASGKHIARHISHDIASYITSLLQ
jgi:hypothetical protein